MNLLIADRDVWRKHRRIMGPAFNSKLFVTGTTPHRVLSITHIFHCVTQRYESVWAETLKTYREMVTEEEWTAKDCVSVSAIQTLSTKVCSVLTVCIFRH